VNICTFSVLNPLSANSSSAEASMRLQNTFVYDIRMIRRMYIIQSTHISSFDLCKLCAYLIAGGGRAYSGTGSRGGSSESQLRV